MTPEEAQAEAVRRIRDCITTGQTWLDLGDLPMAELPRELGETTHVVVQTLGNHELMVRNDGISSEWNRLRRNQRFSKLRKLILSERIVDRLWNCLACFLTFEKTLLREKRNVHCLLPKLPEPSQVC